MLLGVYFLDNTTETTEWTICNLNCLIHCIRSIKILLKFSFFGSAQHTIDVRLRYRCRIIQTSKETQNIRAKT